MIFNRLRETSLKNWELWIILSVVLIQAFLYILVVPPWQHYDEPSHFEYAWLLANRSAFPKPGDFDLTMRKEMVESMIWYDFYARGAKLPDLESDNPPSIGVQQLDDEPLYYLIVSVPLRIAQSWAMTSQLYVGRIATALLFYLVTILAAWGITREITSPANPVRWILPVSIALLPGFTDIMTSVNNDAGAVCFFSLFLWGSIRLIHRGFNWVYLVWVAFAALACFWTKATVFAALPLLFIVLIIVLTRNLRWWIRGLSLGLILLAGLISLLNAGDAAFWYKANSQDIPTRSESNKAVNGNHIFVVDTGSQVAPKWMSPLVQPIPQREISRIVGKTVTLGAWMWADKPIRARMPVLHDATEAYSELVQLREEPAFFAYEVQLPENIERAWISITPRPGKKSPSALIYLDGLVMTEGKYATSQPPQFADPEGRTGTWDGQPFRNLLRNGSAEKNWTGIRPWFNILGTNYFPQYARPSFILSYFQDWQGVGWHAKLIAAQLFRSLWGIFGWGNVDFLGAKPYRIFLAFFLVGTTGGLLWFWQNKKRIPWELVFFITLVLVLVWGSAFIRGISHLPANRLALPVARYAYPAIIPTMLIPAVGWLTISRFFSRNSHKAGRFFSLVYLAIFVFFDIWALVSLLRFYS